MIRISTIWKDLSASIGALKLFKEVKRYPINRITDVDFFKNFPALQLPACLVIWDNRREQVMGNSRSSESNWIMMVVCKDVGGEAYLASADLVEDLCEQMLEKTVCDGNVYINGSHNVEAEPSGIDFGVYSIHVSASQLTTRRAAA